MCVSSAEIWACILWKLHLGVSGRAEVQVSVFRLSWKQHPPGLMAAPASLPSSQLTGRTTGGRRVRNVAGIPSCCINQQLREWLFTSASFSHRWLSLCYTTGGNHGHLHRDCETNSEASAGTLPVTSHECTWTLHPRVFIVHLPKSMYCLKYYCM